MDKKARLESLRKRKRLAELRAKRDAPQEVAVEPAPALQVPEFTTEGSGFLGASVKDSVPLGEHLMSAAKGLEAVGQNLPIVGPMAERGAMALNDMTPEQYEAYKAKSAEQHPIATKAGEAVGSIGPYAAIPGVGLGSLAASLGVSGADQAMRGKSAGEIGANLAQEGIVGGVTMGLGKLLKKLPSPERMRELAGINAEKAAGLHSTKSLRDKLSRMEAAGDIKPGELGNRLLDEGVVQAGDTAKAVAAKSKALYEEAGKEIESLLRGNKAYTQKVQDNLLKQADTPALTALQEKISKKINTQVDLLEELGETIDLSDLNKIKTEIGNEVKDFTSKASSKEAGKRMYESLTDSIQKSLGERELSKLKELNKKYQAGAMASEPASELANKGMSGLKKMGITTAVVTGNPHVAGALAGSHVFDMYKDAFQAVGIRKASNLGKYVVPFAEAAEKGGKTAVGALHFKLMQEDPEYRKKHQKKED